MNLDEMWDRLAQHQPIADVRGYGPAWAVMCAERTQDAAWAATRAAVQAAEAEAAWAAWDAAWAAVHWIERAEEQE